MLLFSLANMPIAFHFHSDANSESRVGSLRDSASHPTTSQANGGLAYTFCPANQGMLCNG